MARPAGPGKGASRSPARLVIALSVAAVLAVFLLYTSIAGGGTPMIQPSELAGRSDRVTLAGHVVGAPRGDAYADGLRFELRNIKDDDGTRVEVLYTGSVPDLFRSGRDVVVDGQLKDGVFVAVPGTLITKCPSKYAPES
ncbi:MAG TPA: cytochrome c maturation protein CcmE [Gaiellaceae bacterium]|nr:cytochrome c maturation protein CcmE [Gaiellaceae bacterium]